MISYKSFCELMTFNDNKKDRPHKISLFSNEEREIISRGYKINIALGKKLEQLYTLIFMEMGAIFQDLNINEDLFFELDGQFYLIEMKTRDDHDSSAINGHIQKFLHKISLAPKGTIALFHFVDEERKNYSKCANYFTVIVGSEIKQYFPTFPYEEIVEYFKRYQDGIRE